jgi:hypothetical protein
MAIEKIIDIKVQGNAEEATKSLRLQLREATLEVQKLSDAYGASSKQAIEAAKRAADLRDRIEDANDAIQAFKGEGAFLATSKALASVASGFAAVQGAMGLLGTESEEVQETILKVQSAMALADGLAGLEDAGRSFKQLATVVQSLSVVQKISTAAQWAWNAAMAANPLGAILTAIVAVIAAGYMLIKFFMDSAEANEQPMEATKRNTESLKAQTKEMEKSAKTLSENNKFQYDMAKANGASTESLRKLAKQHALEEEAMAKKNAMLARSTFLRERDTLATLQADDASEEAIAAQEKLTQAAFKEFEKQRDNYYKAKENTVAIVRQQEVEIAKERTDAIKAQADKESEFRKQQLEKQKAQFEKEREAQKKHVQDLLSLYDKYNNDLQNLNAKTEQEKLDLQKQRDLEEIERIAKVGDERIGLMKLLDEKYAILQSELDANNDEAKREFENQRIAEENERNNKRVEMQIALNDRLIEAEVNLQEAKRNALNAGLEMLSQFAGKNKALAIGILAIQKGLAVADVIVQASKSIAGQKASTFAANMVARATLGPIAGEVVAAKNNAILLSGIAATKIGAATSIAQILATGIMSAKGTLSGDGAGAPNAGGGASGATAPSFNVVGDTGTNQLIGAVNQGKQQPVEAFVVAQNVTSAQSLNRNIVQAATLG